ncbi:metal-dependent hydrolase [Desulfovibrio sp. OttesenSCG-928-I05]|nr:metal-dependent hydrolase [Desulfovibrio sp. OttesenSCG-928-I05]
MSIRLTWHGHANFQIQTDSVNLLIDPFFTGNPVAVQTPVTIETPDLILVTHTHGDHVGDAVSISNDTGALVAGVVGAVEALVEHSGLKEENILNGGGFNIGGTVAFKGVKITMTQAFHTSEAGSPVGYIIQLPGGYTIYHAGDTGIFSSMALWGELYPIDLALLPAGGYYTMDQRQAALAAKLLRAKNVVPMHWGTFPALAQDMQELKLELAQTAPSCTAVIMKPGETRSFG